MAGRIKAISIKIERKEWVKKGGKEKRVAETVEGMLGRRKDLRETKYG